VWWHKAHHAEENEALKEVVAAFEQETGKQVEITFVPLEEQPSNIEAAFEARRPPDIAFGFWLITYIPGWALDYRLLDLTDTVGHFSDLFDPKQLDRALLLNARTGRKAMYGLPMGQISNYIHVWKKPAGARGPGQRSSKVEHYEIASLWVRSARSQTRAVRKSRDG
jgi:multiple sugar transport system substrate-binding protein